MHITPVGPEIGCVLPCHDGGKRKRSGAPAFPSGEISTVTTTKKTNSAYPLLLE
jgi:hypothetical protein